MEDQGKVRVQGQDRCSLIARNQLIVLSTSIVHYEWYCLLWLFFFFSRNMLVVASAGGKYYLGRVGHLETDDVLKRWAIYRSPSFVVFRLTCCKKLFERR